ncbi:MAG: rane-associated phospholipid phosphatase [Bacteroidetes bacterium]|nr:rane-associated phospholipid phosphatase [Bacteroidota bacterium]
MKKFFLLIVSICFLLNPLYSQNDSLSLENKKNFFDKEFISSAKVSSALFLASVSAMPFDKDVRGFRNDNFSTFHQNYDNYLLVAPLGIMYGMKAFGLESRSNWKEMLFVNASSLIIMEAIVFHSKTFIGRERPDGSEYVSFPSGHTATAFACAHLLHKEYGELSPWISVAGYSMATVTGVTRILNNRHWLSDVLFGAGIGILSTELAYKVKDWTFKKKNKKRIILKESL